MRQAMATTSSGDNGSASVGSTSPASSYPRYRNQPPANGHGGGGAGPCSARHHALRRSQKRVAGARTREPSIATENELLAGCGEQDAEAAERSAGRGAVEEGRIAIGMPGVQVQHAARYVGCGWKFANQGFPTPHGGDGVVQRSARKISVPLVPPKPKELLTTVSIFIRRAVCGT